jgi:hypothetical protein
LCRVSSCNADLTDSSRYCLRHRICEEHFKVRQGCPGVGNPQRLAVLQSRSLLSGWS